MTGYLTLLVPLFASMLGSGAFGAWLVHRRLSPKSRAEAREITAAAMERDWARFEREITRLVRRCEAAEDTANEAMGKLRECEGREGRLNARIMELEAYNAGIGKARQDAAGIVAAERAMPQRATETARRFGTTGGGK